MKHRSDAKKRMMFIQKEDYNFLAYNLLLLLDTLDCSGERKTFKDFRKIAYLIDFINEGGEPDKFDQRQLSQIYSKAQIKKKLLHHLLIILRNKKMIGVSPNRTHRSIDIWINRGNIPESFLDKEVFANEINNILQLKKLVYSLKTVNIRDLANKIFTNNNVLVWEA
jgi:hypothetical protein